jgi:hypothetical protein
MHYYLLSTYHNKIDLLDRISHHVLRFATGELVMMDFIDHLRYNGLDYWSLVTSM